MALDLFAAPLDTVTATDVIDFLSRIEVNEEGPRSSTKRPIQVEVFHMIPPSR